MLSAVLLIGGLAAFASELTLDKPMLSRAGPPPNNTAWTDVLALGIRGRGWAAPAMGSPYTRFPASAQGKLCGPAPCSAGCSSPNCEQERCAVWGLSQTATGLSTVFSSTSTDIHVRFNMMAENGDWLWAINGHSGIDVYVQDATTSGEWWWATSSGNNPGNRDGSMAATVLLDGRGHTTSFTATLGTMAATATPRNFTVYLPCRGTVKSVEIGVAPGGTLTPIAATPDAEEKPVVVYGTSILHGAAATHAGMVYSSQMERYTRRKTVNLGFSGHGLMQKEVAEILAELDPVIFVLDCEYNMVKYVGAGHPANHYDWTVIECLTKDFIAILRTARPDTPVLLIEGHDETVNWMHTNGSAIQNSTRNGYRSAYNALLEGGDTGVFYLNGSGKLGGSIANDFEAQAGPIGGCHVGDFAFFHFAHYIGGMVERILNGTEKAAPVALLPALTATDHVGQPVVEPFAAAGDFELQYATNNDDADAERADATASRSLNAAVKFVEATELGLEGVGWPSEEPRYGRLPARAEPVLKNGTDTRYTYDLSWCPSGVLARFSTDATSVTIKVDRHSIGDGMLSLTGRQDDIMSYNGRFGIDVYAEDDHNAGKWRWFQTSTSGSQHVNETMQLASLRPLADGSPRKYTVYFPTHIPVDSLKVGVPAGSHFAAYRPHAGQAPVAIWASSIGQGGVVQNAGMTWISNVGRLLDREVLNFGFSGNCQMQPEVARYLVELKLSVFVMDCLPNMGAASVTARAPSVLKQLRAGLGPDVPILVLEGHTYGNAWVLPAVQSGQSLKRAAQKAAFLEQAKTDKNIFYAGGDGKLASFSAQHMTEATGGVGVHPTNIAHLRIAEYVAAQINSLLK